MNLRRLSTNNLLGIESLEKSDLLGIFSVSDEIQREKESGTARFDYLDGKTVVNLFVEDSTRTRNSFHLAAARLGATVLNVTGRGSSFSKGETLLDTVRVLEAMEIDGLVIRHAAAGAPHFLADRIETPVINAGDGRHEHPTQALLDAWTLYRLWGKDAASFEGKRVGIVGDVTHGRVALSNIFALRALGAEVTLCGPATLIPRGIEALGVTVTHDLDTLLPEVDALIMLRMQLERQSGGFVPSMSEYARLWGVTAARLERAGRSELPILHPGPVNRGVELAGEVTDGPTSLILQQVSNGVTLRMAILAMLLAEEWVTKR